MPKPTGILADEWIKKLWYIYTMEYYLAIKRNTFESVLMRWMNLEPIIQSNPERKKKTNIVLTHIYEIQKYGTNKLIHRAAMETVDVQNRLINGQGCGRGGRG